MTVTTGIAIFFLIWWITLFAVLPWGVRSQGEGSGEIAPGTDPGAPILPRLGVRLIATTVVAGVVFGMFCFLYVYQIVTFDSIIKLLGMPV
jgi:predicted secreted protein